MSHKLWLRTGDGPVIKEPSWLANYNAVFSDSARHAVLEHTRGKILSKILTTLVDFFSRTHFLRLIQYVIVNYLRRRFISDRIKQSFNASDSEVQTVLSVYNTVYSKHDVFKWRAQAFTASVEAEINDMNLSKIQRHIKVRRRVKIVLYWIIIYILIVRCNNY